MHCCASPGTAHHSPAEAVGLAVVVVIVVLEVLVGGGVLGVVTVGRGQDGDGGVIHKVAGKVVVILLGLLLSWHCWLQVLLVDTSIGSGASGGSETWTPTFTSTL